MRYSIVITLLLLISCEKSQTFQQRLDEALKYMLDFGVIGTGTIEDLNLNISNLKLMKYLTSIMVEKS
jgi:hypothetical protein